VHVKRLAVQRWCFMTRWRLQYASASGHRCPNVNQPSIMIGHGQTLTSLMDKQTKLAISLFLVIVALILIIGVYGYMAGRWDWEP
jgi:hypothetical protein